MAPMGDQVRTPSPVLRPYVDSMVGYHEVMDPRAVHHGLPSPSTTVIIAFDEPLDTAWLGDPTSRDRYWSLAAGLHPEPALIRTHGIQHGIQLSLTPAGVRRFLGLPVGALATALVHHRDLPLGISDHLREELEALPCWTARFDRLERHLGDLVGHDRGVIRPELAHAWHLLTRARPARVAEAAVEVGWSRRHLASRFRDEFGITPQDAVRVARFDTARRLALAGRPLAEVAATAGYADQPHLTREWRRLAGQTPTETLAGPFPIVQDDPALDVAS